MPSGMAVRCTVDLSKQKVVKARRLFQFDVTEANIEGNHMGTILELRGYAILTAFSLSRVKAV
jgi:hypothetical protein